MLYLCFHHTVGDYALWKERFDMQLAPRQAGGATHEVIILRNIESPQEIIILLGWRDLCQARGYIDSVSWQMSLHTTGMIALSEVQLLERV